MNDSDPGGIDLMCSKKEYNKQLSFTKSNEKSKLQSQGFRNPAYGNSACLT